MTCYWLISIVAQSALINNPLNTIDTDSQRGNDGLVLDCNVLQKHSVPQLTYPFVMPQPYHPASAGRLERLTYSPLRKTPQRIDTALRQCFLEIGGKREMINDLRSLQSK